MSLFTETQRNSDIAASGHRESPRDVHMYMCQQSSLKMTNSSTIRILQHRASLFLTFPGLSSMVIKLLVWPAMQTVVPATDRSSSTRLTPSFWSTAAVLLNVTRQKTLTSSKALGTKQNLCQCSQKLHYS